MPNNTITAVRVLWEGSACACCALVIANGDDSGCRDYYGHTHESAHLPARVVRQLNEAHPELVTEGISWDGWLVVTGDEDHDGFCDLCDQYDGYAMVTDVAVIR